MHERLYVLGYRYCTLVQVLVPWYRYWYPGTGPGTLVQIHTVYRYRNCGTLVQIHTVYRYRLGFQARLIRDSPEISRLTGINGVQVIRVNQIKLFLH